MKQLKLNDWIETVGLIALVGSLIFVGLQMKQSQEIAIAAHYQERASIASEYYLARLQSEHPLADRAISLTDSFNSGLLGPAATEYFEERGAQSLAIKYLHYLKAFTLIDNHFFQYASHIRICARKYLRRLTPRRDQARR